MAKRSSMIAGAGLSDGSPSASSTHAGDVSVCYAPPRRNSRLHNSAAAPPLPAYSESAETHCTTRTKGRYAMLTYRNNLTAALIVVAITALAGNAIAQAPQPPAGQSPQVVRPADLMTQPERDAFRKQMETAKTPEERQKVRDAHRAAMEQRAKDKGVTLAQPGGRGEHGGRGPGGGHAHGAGPRDGGVQSQLFTEQERNQFREQMHGAKTTEERLKLRDEHRAMAEARAKEKGITLPPPGQRGPRGPAPAAPQS
jgi:pyruvate/2-oxoglutarate dehydrogenase complex dihydrolipoamide acyltransferase (E2) component